SPPEQSEATDLDRTADVYALGAVMYRALAGVPPTDAEKRTRDMALNGADSYVPLAQRLLTDVPAHALATVDRTLGLRPRDRRQSINDRRAGLGWSGNGHSAWIFPATTDERPTRPSETPTLPGAVGVRPGKGKSSATLLG